MPNRKQDSALPVFAHQESTLALKHFCNQNSRCYI